ncbi:MAG: murein DD-endopeptidase MepM/ murein hydrolase activator NlpD [Cyclobacteriaceae bacterium]|jgi:murein DD-endopeptidase MepM/ murein hydrolase activator NlpD
MMNQKKSNNKVAFRTLLALACILGIAFLFSFRQPLTIESHNFKLLSDIYILLEQGAAHNPPSIFPVKISDGVKVRVSSGFGKRIDPFDKVEKWHRGIDIATAKGSPVIATVNGTVELVKFQPNRYGNFVVIKHDDIYKTKYAQLDSYIVGIGDIVKKGDVIGYVGSSGKSTASSL